MYTKFCIELKVRAKTYKIAILEEAMRFMQVLEWLHYFEDGSTSMESDIFSGRPSSMKQLRNQEFLFSHAGQFQLNVCA